MEINPNLNLKPGSLNADDAAPAAVRNWRVGTVLNAVATSADRAGSAALRIGGQTFRAQVPFSVQPGDRMLLEVIRTGATPLLRPVDAQRTPDPVQAALRAALPRQGALPPLLANLTQLATARDLPSLPPQVQEVARALFQRLATERQVGTADGLRRAAADAGTQLETKLAQAASGRAPATAIGDDFKGGLLRLRETVAQALRSAAQPPGSDRSVAGARPEVRTMPLAAPANPARAAAAETAPQGPNTPVPPSAGKTVPPPTVRVVPPLLPPLADNQPQAQGRASPFPALLEPAKLLQGLLQQVDASLARLQLNQLASQPTDGDQRQVWLLELPVRRDQSVDVLHLRIEHEDGSHTDHARRAQGGWTVQVAFDLDGLGPVQARVALQSGQVSTAFWTDRADTNELFRRHLEELRTQLQAAGLEVAGMSCQVGSPQPAQPAAGSASGLVDEQA